MKFILVCFLMYIIFRESIAKSSIRKNYGPRIVNGREGTSGQFPWQVLLSINSDYSSWNCGGALIDELWILTAAHCFQNWVGIMLEEPALDENFIHDVIIHEQYDFYTLANDIALLKLPEPIIPNQVSTNVSVKAIELGSEPLESNLEIVISGYGNGSSLLYGTLTTIDDSECDEIYGNGTILDGMFCAVSSTANEKTATCFGDNGGPAVIYNDEENPIHVGVITFISDRGCEHGDPSGFARTAYYREWIREKTGI